VEDITFDVGNRRVAELANEARLALSYQSRRSSIRSISNPRVSFVQDVFGGQGELVRLVFESDIQLSIVVRTF
jgi:hypothetical protein